MTLGCVLLFAFACGRGASQDAPPAEADRPTATVPSDAEPAVAEPRGAEPAVAGPLIEPDRPAVEEPPGEQPPPELAAAEPPPEGPSTEPVEPAAEEPDPYAVPEGATGAELVDFINGVLQQQPPNEAAAEKAVAALLDATGKILEGDPTEEQAEFAVTWRMRLLGDPVKIEAFAEELKEAGRDKLARMVVGRVLAGKLRMAGFGPREDLVTLLGEVREYLEAGPIEGPAVGLAMAAGQAAERSGDDKLAVETYEQLSKLFAESDDPQIAQFAEKLNGIVRRLQLPGNPIEVEGKMLDGTPLDWSKYEGEKVVLVDFWATWCGPCVAEIPNMKEVYEKYHERGFEIVGISLDRSREDLEAFVKDREIPWPIVYGDEGPSPTADYYGVMAIPTMILVGADGKVVSTRARGDVLREQLEKLLGPVEGPVEGETPPTD